MFRVDVPSKDKEGIGVGFYGGKYAEMTDFEYQVICISAQQAMNTFVSRWIFRADISWPRRRGIHS
jgi:hypothetical protein